MTGTLASYVPSSRIEQDEATLQLLLRIFSSAPRVLKERLSPVKVYLFSFRAGARSGLYGAQLFGLELASSYAQLRVLTLVKPA